MSQKLVRVWTSELLKHDDLPKKDLIKFFQDNAAHSFLNEHRLLGKKNKKTAINEQLVDAMTSKCLSAQGLSHGGDEEMTKSTKAKKVKAEVVDEVGPKSFRVHPILPKKQR
ncbi:uncharacterized protein LOC144093269 isoform X2 [Stigmatopora argus]